MPNLLNPQDIDSLKDNPDYIANARKNLLADLLNKYNANPPALNYKTPNVLSESNKFGETPNSWNYSDGMMGYTSPLLDGDLNTRLGRDKMKFQFGNKNNNFDLNIGAGGNHDINWNRKF